MGTDLYPNNKLVSKLAHENDWIYGLYWYGADDDRKYFIDDKMIGIKYHGSYNKKPVTSINPLNLEQLDKIKGILLVHCGRYAEGDIKSNTSYLHAVKVAREYPNIKVILAHMGGTDTTVCKKAIDHASRLWNVYFDTSGITTPYIIEYACEMLPSTRILFGSDYPWCSYNAMLWTIRDSMISKEAMTDIFQNNFESLLK